MDQNSKEMLKRDFFVQGLWLKWQEKVLPSAKTFDEALHQARAAEQQEKQLSSLHHTEPSTKPSTVAKTTPTSKPLRVTATPFKPTKSVDSNRRPRGLCHECGSPSHKWRDCPNLKPHTETPGRSGKNRATNAAISTAPHELPEDRCQRLQQEWVDAEFKLLSQGYAAETAARVDKVTGAVGPLFYCTVVIHGKPV